MRIHLITSSMDDIPLGCQIADIINQADGPVEIVVHETEIEFNDSDIEIQRLDYDEFIKQDDEVDFASFDDLSNEFSSYKMRVVEWSTLFNAAQQFKKKEDISDEDFCVLLTDLANDKNWFSAMHPSGNNVGFVHTSDWGHFIDGDLQFALAYEIMSMPFQNKMMQQGNAFHDIVHSTPIGCISDMCADKRDVQLKLRTADICDECYERFRTWNMSESLIEQALSVFENVRKQLLFKRRFRNTNRISTVEIRGRLLDLYLVDMNDRKIEFNPQEKAIYLLHLLHPEGLDSVEFSEKENELKVIYRTITSFSETHDIEHAIRQLVRLADNTISVKRSQLNRKLTNILGEELASHYKVKGPRGGRKNIELNRSSVRGIELVHNVLSS